MCGKPGDGGSTVGYDLGVDLGGTTVVAAVLRDGEARAVAVGLGPDGAVTVPAVAHRGTDGVVRTGVDAEHRAAVEPDRVVRDVTARLGDDVPLVVGDEPWRADDVAAEIVLAAVRRVAALEGGAARSLAVTHPAGWGPHRERMLRRALVRVGLGHATLVGESRAAVLAASTFGGLRSGRVAAVYDLGGRRFRAAVVRRSTRGVPGTRASAEVLADAGTPVRAGGSDIDAAVLAHVREELGEALDSALAELEDDAARASLTALRRSAREAKERLSADTEADVAVEVGTLATVVRVTRADLEARITPLVAATVDAFAGTLDAAGVAPDQIVLVGGSARVPLVARLLAEELGRPVHPELDPVTVVAQGAALAAAEHAVSRRQEALGIPAPTPAVPVAAGPASAAFPTTAAPVPPTGGFPPPSPRIATFPTTAVASPTTGAAPDAPPVTGSFPTTAPAGTGHQAAAGAAVAAGVALAASAARRPVTAAAEEPDDRWGPAPITGPTAVPGQELATRDADARPATGRGSTALLERPHTPGGDVPRPPVGTGAAPIGPQAPQGALRRYRPWLLAALAIVVLAAAAAMVPIPGLTSARTEQPAPPATSTPAVPPPTPGAMAPPLPVAPVPAPAAGGSAEETTGSSVSRTSSADPTSSTRSSRTPSAFAPAAARPASSRPAAQKPVAKQPVQKPVSPPAAPAVQAPAPSPTGTAEAPAAVDPPAALAPGSSDSQAPTTTGTAS